MSKLKKILKITTSVMLLVGMVGCSNPTTESKVVVDEELRDKVVSSNLLSLDHMDSNAKEHYMFEGVTDKIKSGFVSQAQINVKLQDVVVVEGNSENDAKELYKAIEYYKENSLRMFADGYGGEENATAVANSILKQEGSVVYFIACEKAEDIEKLIKGE